LRNSYVHIRRNGPDTTELDAGWDFEPGEQPDPPDVFDSLQPSAASLRPSPDRAALFPTVARSRPRRLKATALILSSAMLGGALVGVVLGRWKSRAASAASAAAVVRAELPPSRIPAVGSSTGHRTRVVEVDGSADSLHIRLEPIPRHRPPKAQPTSAKVEPVSAAAVAPSGGESKRSSEAEMAYPE
jgi:hypothetical protein